MSPVVRLGLLMLAAVGGGMLWLQREQPVDGVTILSCAVGGSPQRAGWRAAHQAPAKVDGERAVYTRNALRRHCVVVLCNL